MSILKSVYPKKNQIIPKIYPKHKERALKRYMLHETNLKILERPYLTQAEEDGHMEALGFTKEAQQREQFLVETKNRWNKPMEKRIHYLEEHLKHLNVRKSWE